jgi:hydroxyacylglutathione hydrolase
VGYERRFNDALLIKDLDRFTSYMEDDQPLKPANILNIVAINQGHRALSKGRPKAEPLRPAEVQRLMDEGHYVVDARSSPSFGAGHIRGSVNVQMSSKEFEQRVGWVIPDSSPIILLTDKDADAQTCIFNMAFIGLDQFVTGFVLGGIDAWMADGLPVEVTPQIDVFTLHSRLSDNGMKVLDVREQDEWDEGHIAGSSLMPYTHMAPQLTVPAQIHRLEFEKDQSIAVTCATAKRSSTAIGLLLRAGYTNLYNVTGGMDAWARAKLPMVDGEGTACAI